MAASNFEGAVGKGMAYMVLEREEKYKSTHSTYSGLCKYHNVYQLLQACHVISG